jgi:hypothetical protein
MKEGYVNSESVNILDDCWDMINQPPDDLSEMISDSYPGL